MKKYYVLFLIFVFFAILAGCKTNQTPSAAQTPTAVHSGTITATATQAISSTNSPTATETMTPPPACTPDADEPANDTGISVTLPYDDSQHDHHTSNDIDVYNFTGTAGYFVNVSTLDIEVHAYTVIYLFDLTGGSPVSLGSDITDFNGTLLNIQLINTGLHSVRVSQYNNCAIGPGCGDINSCATGYRIQISSGIASPTPTFTPTTVVSGACVYAYGNPANNDNRNWGANVMTSTYFTAGTVTSIHRVSVKLDSANRVSVGIYSDTSGKPGTKIAETGGFNTVAGWNEADLTTTCNLVSGNTYWIAAVAQGSGGSVREFDASTIGGEICNFTYSDTLPADLSGQTWYTEPTREMKAFVFTCP